MSLNLNPWVALILGILIGWLLQWLLELLFFCRRRFEFENRLAEAETQVKTRQAELDETLARAKAREVDLAGAQAAAALPQAEAEAPNVDLTKAAAAVSLAGAAGELQAEAPAVEAPAVDIRAVEVAAEAPEAELPGIAIVAPGVGLGGAAVAAGVGAVALAGHLAGGNRKTRSRLPWLGSRSRKSRLRLPKPTCQRSRLRPRGWLGGAAVAAGVGAVALAGHLAGAEPEDAVEAPVVEVEVPEVAIEAPEAGLPGIAVAAPGMDLGGVALVAGVGAGLANLDDAEPETRAGQVAIETTLPVSPARIEADDLLQVKGIGPKYATQLNAAGIATYAALADSPSTGCRRSSTHRRGGKWTSTPGSPRLAPLPSPASHRGRRRSYDPGRHWAGVRGKTERRGHRDLRTIGGGR